MDTGGFSAGVKRLGREADNSPLYNAEVKNAWNCTSTPPYAQLYLYFFKDISKIRQSGSQAVSQSVSQLYQCAVSWRSEQFVCLCDVLIYVGSLFLMYTFDLL
jgi:hypothetical protein